MDVISLKNNFNKFSYSNEDDIKIHFYSEIAKPIIGEVNPDALDDFKSEDTLKNGGRTDATFQSISFEYKRMNYFANQNGVNEALYGRDHNDHGLYDYIISNADINKNDSIDEIISKIEKGIGIGFDGKHFIFARYVPSLNKNTIDTSKLKIHINEPLPIQFDYDIEQFDEGIRKLTKIFKQQHKWTLSKSNLILFFGPQTPFVRDSVKKLYDILSYNLDYNNGSKRIRILYDEWDRIFGKLYGDDSEATGFNEVTPFLKNLYALDLNIDINSKRFLFSVQTIFNIILKVLVYSFLKESIDPSLNTSTQMNSTEINNLFIGKNNNKALIQNFFECHFLEWFTFSDYKKDEITIIVNKGFEIINNFDFNTFRLKPEQFHDVLQELYMELVPHQMRHIMGEYFSPDWIVEYAILCSGFNGDIHKRIVDPTCGSGSFLTHAIKKIADQRKQLSLEDIGLIVDNIVGFDINPISVISAKANYILALFSYCEESVFKDLRNKPIEIPVYIADSVLSPIIYSEDKESYLSIETSVATFKIPKFNNYRNASKFLQLLHINIDESRTFNEFWNKISGFKLVSMDGEPTVRELYSTISSLHNDEKDSFWPIILRNSFAPILINDQFDYVIGNPPWITWKRMSKSYRNGTLDIWKSYGIFEKNSYDKITTHDDFGMAVTYVSVDKYLKMNGTLVYLLPVAFLKSSKGGEGFRKLLITRNGQNVPMSIEQVDDFSEVKLFNTNTAVVKIIKGKQMAYPLKHYNVWVQINNNSKLDSHTTWNDAKTMLNCDIIQARPVDPTNDKSSWLTMKDFSFADLILNSSKEHYYKGRKGIEPAGAKGIYVLKKPKRLYDGTLAIENDISRQRRTDLKDKGVNPGHIEETCIYPMLGGRNIDKWCVKSNEFIIVPNSSQYKYGIPEAQLEKDCPLTFEWLYYYHDELLASRIQNVKRYDLKQPFYRLDNVGDYTFAPYKVLWKEQSKHMSAVVIGSYLQTIPNADVSLFTEDKTIVVDSKVLMLGLYNEDEAHYVCGILNSKCIDEVIDSYSIAINRGIEVLSYVSIPKYNPNNKIHKQIANLSIIIHQLYKNNENDKATKYIHELNEIVYSMYINKV